MTHHIYLSRLDEIARFNYKNDFFGSKIKNESAKLYPMQLP
jgi:hypothetical protein